jgi:hypothetical protein
LLYCGNESTHAFVDAAISRVDKVYAEFWEIAFWKDLNQFSSVYGIRNDEVRQSQNAKAIKPSFQQK